jgi:hypothetical protein
VRVTRPLELWERARTSLGSKVGLALIRKVGVWGSLMVQHMFTSLGFFIQHWKEQTERSSAPWNSPACKLLLCTGVSWLPWRLLCSKGSV